jgi:TolB-like protein/DNA-binding winged helix-turn-helix (wHTH) protein/tetratricopeptide (TPR) repeat protein
MADTDQSRTVRFGLFELDLRAGELRKNGVKVKLQEQPFRILVSLLRQPGDVVTREELRRELWPSDTFVDFDHSLNAAVKRLRDALDDSAENPRFIETLPRHGYRFISATVPDALQRKATRFPLRSWGLLLVGGTILVAVLLFAVDAGGLRSKVLSRAVTQPQIRSLAVLPLTNISGDPEQEYFADGMTEELITELSRIGSLRVISRTSVMQYKQEKKPLPQIALELKVDAVMEGSVLRSGNQVRIATHMIYAPTDQNLMTETYVRDLGDVLKLQREVAESITEKVRAKLTPEQKARLHQSRQVDPEAFEAYMRAANLNWGSPQENKESQSYLEKAIQKDPSFAEAYAALAWTRIHLGQFRWISPQNSYPPAKQAARKALELDEKNCRAHSALAYLAGRYEWDWATADSESRLAVELCPNSAKIHGDLAFYRAYSGRSAEALTELAKARELDPLLEEMQHRFEAVINYHLRNYKGLVEESYAGWAPHAWGGHYFLGVGYEGSGQTLKAVSEYQKAVELSQGDSDPTAALAHAFAATGRKPEVRKILREWLRQSENNYISPYMIATVYASLGQKDKAFDYLEKAYQERSSDLPYFLRADLRVDSLRSDPRFQDLMRRMNFPK